MDTKPGNPKILKMEQNDVKINLASTSIYVRFFFRFINLKHILFRKYLLVY